jgi:hypothetical protein
MALTDSASTELEDLAKQHPSWESFLQEGMRELDRIWHKVRSNGDQAKLDDDKIYGDSPEEGASDHRSTEELTGVKSKKAAPPSTPGSPSVPGSPASPSDPS